jgi:hypothetical protein
MRILLWLLPLGVVLSACNVANSDHPMLAGEPRSAVKLKDGLWVAEDPKCRVDRRRPVRRWPRCAYWLVFTDGNVVGARDAKPNDLPIQLVIAEGKPPIVELPLKEQGQEEAKLYAYVAIEPTRFDSKGAAVDLRLWGVACGIEEKTGSIQGKIRHFPGMDDDCHPASVEVLRTAAAAGPQGSDKKARWRWIRATAN